MYFHVPGRVMTAPWFYASNRAANRVTKMEYPGEIVGDEEFGYDDAGGLLWKKDGNGKFTLYQYDDLHRLIAVYYLPGALPNPISYEGLTAGVTYTYHGGTSQRETMIDAAGPSEFEYDALTCPQSLVHMLCHRFR